MGDSQDDKLQPCPFCNFTPAIYESLRKKRENTAAFPAYRFFAPRIVRLVVASDRFGVYCENCGTLVCQDATNPQQAAKLWNDRERREPAS